MNLDLRPKPLALSCLYAFAYQRIGALAYSLFPTYSHRAGLELVRAA